MFSVENTGTSSEVEIEEYEKKGKRVENVLLVKLFLNPFASQNRLRKTLRGRKGFRR